MAKKAGLDHDDEEGQNHPVANGRVEENVLGYRGVRNGVGRRHWHG